MIILFTTLCILNLVIHYNELRDEPDNIDMSGGEIFVEVLNKYWISIVGAFIAVLVSLSPF